MICISKLIDHILSNTCLIESNSFYYGKAGISLALFEAFRYTQNENTENEAFNLLQEALVSQRGDCSFEKGLSGIGYVLCYLIENKFIEADFDEIFGEQYEKIIKSFEKIELNPEKLLSSPRVIYFLSLVKNVKPKDERPQKIIKKIFEGLELFLIVQFQDFTDINYINDKMSVLNIYETYLKLINYTNYRYFSHSLLRNYVNLYQSGILTTSPYIGYYLAMLVNENKITGYDDVINDHIINGGKNINFDNLSLKEKVDFIKLISDMEDNGIKHHNPAINLKEMKQNLFLQIDVNSCMLDYEIGLSRLLLFCVNRRTKLL